MNIERILMTGDTVGGVWTFTLELAEGLTRQGVEVLLVAFGGKASAGQRDEARAIPGLRLLDSEYKLEWMDDPWEDVEASGRWLFQIAEEYEPDLIHLNSYGHGSLPWSRLRKPAPVVLTAHSCVLSWWQAVKGEPAPPAWNHYHELVKAALSAADLVTTPTLAMAMELSEHYGLPPQACSVVPNGRHVSRFSRGEKEPFLLTAGRLWDEAKNVRAVADIAAKLAWPVYCAGEPSPAQTTVSADGCNMLGRLSASELAAWYTRAAIYIMPAYYEPFGLSILEAALSGCALVLGDIPSLREIWMDAAVFVPPGDSPALETALRNLIVDTVRRHHLARRAHARALEFDSDRTCRAYLRAYEDALASLRTKTAPLAESYVCAS
jgi:glycogen synthase